MKSSGAVAAIALAACSTTDVGQTAGYVHLDRILNDPSVFEGRSVTTCGYGMHQPEANNILTRAARRATARTWTPTSGLRVVWNDRPLDSPRSSLQWVCVTGEVQRAGCHSDRVICLDSSFDWQIVEDRRSIN